MSNRLSTADTIRHNLPDDDWGMDLDTVEWVAQYVDKLEALARILAEVHQPDNDELGTCARRLLAMLDNRKRCSYVGEVPGSEIGQQGGMTARCTDEDGHDGWHTYQSELARQWRELGQ